MKYNIVKDDGEYSSATVFLDSGDMLVATSDHPNFRAIISALEGKKNTMTDEQITGLFDVGKVLDMKFRQVSERVYVKAGKVYFDAMPQNGALADTIIAFYAEGNDNLLALVNFMEKIKLNPNPHSQEHLFRWIKANHFGITEDGDIIGYKGVNRKTGKDTTDTRYVSTQCGYAIVDGEPMTDFIPQVPGTVIEMPRDMVTFDPNQTCSVGLHVADWSYAQGMGGGVTLQVLVNPRDVVSITNDHRDKKMRCCRYKVLGVVTAEDKSILFVDREIATMTARAKTVRPSTVAIGRADKGSNVVDKILASAEKDVQAENERNAAKAAANKSAAPVKSAAPAKKAAAKKAGTTAKKVGAKKVEPTVTKAATKPTAGKAAVSKKVAPKSAGKVIAKPLPKYYEEFKKADFEKLPFKKLQWLAKEWEITVGERSTAGYVDALIKAARARLKKAGKTKITS